MHGFSSSVKRYYIGNYSNTSRIVTYATEYENCPAWSTIEAILITFSFYQIIRLDVWIHSQDILLHVISWKWICMWQIRSIGCRRTWTSRTEHRTIDDMMVQCLVAGDLEALIFVTGWSLCERLYALIEISAPHFFFKCLCLYQLKIQQLTINKKCLHFPVRLQPNMHMYVSVYVHAHVYVCIYINACTCIHVINV